jgi:hypothetical protein
MPNDRALGVGGIRAAMQKSGNPPQREFSEISDQKIG